MPGGKPIGDLHTYINNLLFIIPPGMGFAITSLAQAMFSIHLFSARCLLICSRGGFKRDKATIDGKQKARLLPK